MPEGYSFDHSHNLWEGGVPQALADGTSIAGDPGFQSPSLLMGSSGFRLKAGSACIGAGLSIPAVTNDFFCNNRKPEVPTIGVHQP